MSLRNRWKVILDDLAGRHCLRRLEPARGVDFCSNDYLGYAGTRSHLQATSPGDDSYLATQRSATAARLLRGHHEIWDEVESKLAGWHGVESCLMMNSGYAANEGLLSTVLQPNDWVASDAANHASIIDGLRLTRAERFIYRHCDLGHLEEGLAAAERDTSRELFIVTETLFGMDGDIAPLADIVKLGQRYGAHVIVDEAHATGCFGATGAGLVDELGIREQVLASVHTGGKALGVAGAYICGDALLRELLLNRCRHFMFSTALPPAVGEWWRQSIDRVQSDRAGRSQLHAAARGFRVELERHGVSCLGTEYVIPVVMRDDATCVRAAAGLQALGWDVRPIRFPTVPQDSPRLRFSIHADHTPELLAEVAAGLAHELSRIR